MDKRKFAVLAVAVAAVTGCSHSNKSVVPQPLAGLFKTVSAMPGCTPQPGDIKSTMDVVLPNNFDGGKIAREVYDGPAVAKGDPKIGKGQPDWTPNQPPGGNSPSTPPFDGYVYTNDTSTGYMLVRVLLTNGAQFGFQSPGVGRNDASSDALCGAQVVNISGGPGQAQQAAIFYADLAKIHSLGVGNSVSFTIGLLSDSKGPGGAPTPILIDPKITDDGSSTRLHG